MPVSATTIDHVRRACGAAALEKLAEMPFDQLTCGAVIEHADLGEDTALGGRLFTSVAGMVEQGLRDRDQAVLVRLAEDFDADTEASIHDKVLEGLIARYEDYTPIRTAFRHLNKAATRDPMLAAMLITCLNEASRGLLNIAGADTDGLVGMARVKGISGVALACHRDWLNDDTDDLSATIRSLDKRLKQAEDLAQLLRLIDRDEGPKEDTGHD